MTNGSSDALGVLSRALDQAGEVLAVVRPDQLDRPTPCPDWDVSQLIAHLVEAPARFTTMVKGGEPDWTAEPQPVAGNPVAAFRSAADELLLAWGQVAAAGEQEELGQADWQTAEIAVHTWDLARATEQSTDLDPEVAERGLAFMSAALTADNRGNAFAAEVAVPNDAPVYDRLAAVAGRQPSRAP